MKVRIVVALIGLVFLGWYATVGFTSQVTGAHVGTSTVHIDVPSKEDLPNLTDPVGEPAPPAPAPDPVPAPEPEPAPAPNPGLGGVGQDVKDAGGSLADSAGAWAASAWDWIQQYALWIMIGAVALAVIAALGKRTKDGDDVVKDPQRMYTTEQRTESFARAGGQCEYMSWALSRCGAPAEHADHFFPHSKGGATSLLNCVASCAHHNTSKGAKVLPKRAGKFLEMRRKRYYPAGVPVTVGELYDPSAGDEVMADDVAHVAMIAQDWQDPAEDLPELDDPVFVPASWDETELAPTTHPAPASDDIHDMYR